MKNKILKNTTVIALIGILFASCSPKAQYINALYKPDVLKTESKTSVKEMLYDKGSGILYKISNNEKFLVADLQINSEATQKKILLFGLTMWVDETGKKKKTFGVKFPIGRSGFKNSSMHTMKETQGNFRQKKKMLVDESNEIAIIGQKEKGDIELIDKRYKNGIKADITFDSFGMMHYQLKVPFGTINMTYKDLILQNPSIGFETGHAEMNQSPGHGSGMNPGGGSGGGSGKNGGMKPGGGTSGSNPEMQSMMQASSFWIKNIKLADSDN